MKITFYFFYVEVLHSWNCETSQKVKFVFFFRKYLLHSEFFLNFAAVVSTITNH